MNQKESSGYKGEALNALKKVRANMVRNIFAGKSGILLIGHVIFLSVPYN